MSKKLINNKLEKFISEKKTVKEIKNNEAYVNQLSIDHSKKSIKEEKKFKES